MVNVPPTVKVKLPGVKVAVVESASSLLYQEPVVARLVTVIECSPVAADEVAVALRTEVLLLVALFDSSAPVKSVNDCTLVSSADRSELIAPRSLSCVRMVDCSFSRLASGARSPASICETTLLTSMPEPESGFDMVIPVVATSTPVLAELIAVVDIFCSSS